MWGALHRTWVLTDRACSAIYMARHLPGEFEWKRATDLLRQSRHSVLLDDTFDGQSDVIWIDWVATNGVKTRRVCSSLPGFSLEPCRYHWVVEVGRNSHDYQRETARVENSICFLSDFDWDCDPTTCRGLDEAENAIDVGRGPLAIRNLYFQQTYRTAASWPEIDWRQKGLYRNLFWSIVSAPISLLLTRAPSVNTTCQHWQMTRQEKAGKKMNWTHACYKSVIG